jgi:hypothetical protein
MVPARGRSWRRFLAAYLVVYGVMVGWWWVMRTTAEAGRPIPTVLIGYLVPVVVVVGIVIWGRRLPGRSNDDL